MLYLSQFSVTGCFFSMHETKSHWALFSFSWLVRDQRQCLIFYTPHLPLSFPLIHSLSSLFFPFTLCVRSFFISCLVTFTSRPTSWPCLSEVISEVLLAIPLLWWLQPSTSFTSFCSKADCIQFSRLCYSLLKMHCCRHVSAFLLDHVDFWCHELRCCLTRGCAVI